MVGHGFKRENLELALWPSAAPARSRPSLHPCHLSTVLFFVVYTRNRMPFDCHYVYYESNQPSLSRWSLGHAVQSVLGFTGADLCPFGDLLTDHNILCPPVILLCQAPLGGFTHLIYSLRVSSRVHSRRPSLSTFQP
jgi:hypothetical protein